MVSTGDRSAKIRTYNYPQGRVTDHRINLTLYNLAAIMDGDIQEIIDKLQFAENAERLKAAAEGKRLRRLGYLIVFAASEPRRKIRVRVGRFGYNFRKQ